MVLFALVLNWTVSVPGVKIAMIGMTLEECQ